MFGVPFHNLAVHFPIVLALVAVLYDGWARYSGNRALHSAASGLTILAAVSAAAATASGLNHAGATGLGSGSATTGHAIIGILATIVLAGGASWRYAAHARGDSAEEAYTDGWLLLGAVGAVLVLITAIAGHRIYG